MEKMPARICGSVGMAEYRCYKTQTVGTFLGKSLNVPTFSFNMVIVHEKHPKGKNEENDMNIDTKDILNSILKSISGIDYIKADDVPNIDLYMDQVTTFMEAHLSGSKRYPEDKILTKTMINNYTKNELLPSPEKKKYSQEHLLLLIFIYYFKSILSITDIQALLQPLGERYFQSEENLTLKEIYEEVFSLEQERIEILKKDVEATYQRAFETFAEAPTDQQELLRRFAFICMLSFDVYLKKQMIEKLIDGMAEETKASEKQKEKKKKE